MTATATRKPSKARQAKVEALQKTLAEEIEALRDPERWINWLQFAATFHSYSWRNQLLMAAQYPGASLVAGYRGWQARGRQVRRGERGIMIWGGRPYRRVTEEADDDDTTATGMHFFPVTVFDISQTDALEGTETPEHPLEGSLTDQDDPGIIEAVSGLLDSRGIPVVFENLPGTIDGRTQADRRTGKITRVSIDPRNPVSAQAATLLHELAHIELGHMGRTQDYHGAERGLFEVEAESVAYIVANLMGLDTVTISAGYVAGWASVADTDALAATAEHVATTAHTIAEVLNLSA